MSDRFPHDSSERAQQSKDTVGAASAFHSELEAKANEPPKLSYLGTAVDSVMATFVSDPSTRAEVDQYGTNFVKAATLFLRGRLGLAGTVASYALDQMRPGDDVGTQMLDGTLGSAKGLAMRGIFNKVGSADLDFATKGIMLGTSSRVVDSALTRQTYINDKGQVSFGDAAERITNTAINPAALTADIVTFGIAHGAFRGINGLSSGALDRSPLISNMLMGTTFGASTGGYAELARQRAAGEEIDFGKVAKHALIQGGLDSIAAIPGGLQTRSMMRDLAQTNQIEAQLGLRGQRVQWATDGQRVPTMTDIRFAGDAEAPKLWHEAANYPKGNEYSLGSVIRNLPEQARFDAFKRALDEFPSDALRSTVQSIPSHQMKNLAGEIARSRTISDREKQDLIFQIRFERFDAKQISEMLETANNHPAALGALREWWQYQHPTTEGGRLRSELSKTLPATTLGELVYGKANSEIGSQMAQRSPDTLQEVARNMGIIGEGPAVEQLSAVSGAWLRTGSLKAAVDAGIQSAKRIPLDKDSPSAVPDAIQSFALKSTPAERAETLSELSQIASRPYTPESEQSVHMAYKMAAAIGRVDGEAVSQHFLNAIKSKAAEPDVSLDWRLFTAARLAEMQRAGVTQAAEVKIDGISAKLDPVPESEKQGILESISRIQQSADPNLVPLKLMGMVERAVEQIEPSQARFVGERMADAKPAVKALSEDANFNALPVEQQRDVILATLLKNTIQSGDTANGAAKSALAVEAVVRSLGYSAERANRIGTIVARSHELQFNPAEPKSGQLANADARESAATWFRNPYALQQAMMVNRAEALTKYGTENTGRIDAELNRTHQIIAQEAADLNRNFVPVLHSEWPSRFGVVEAPRDYVAQAHTSDDIGTGRIFDLLPMMQSRQYSASTSLVKPDHQVLFDETANVVGLFSAPAENTAQAFPGSLWSGTATSAGEHVQLAREWRRDESAIRFADRMNGKLSSLGFGRGQSGENAALRDYQQQILRYNTLDEMLRSELPGSPLRQAHQVVVDGYTKMSDGTPLPGYNEFKTINPILTGIGILRQGRPVIFEDNTVIGTFGTQPLWLSNGHAADAIVIPHTVTEQARNSDLPIVILDP